MVLPQGDKAGYFQQEVNFDIEVTLDDIRHELNATERIEYINNSGDTLEILYFHIWPNAYSSNKTALAKQLLGFNGRQKLFNDPEKAGFIDSLDFKVNSKPVEWNLLEGKPDICILKLNDSLFPGDTIIITTPFHVKIPGADISRLGHSGQSYHIAQWYPKPAVYDAKGWHPIEYLDQGEFYSEFGNFNVRITLPANYIVAASGNLMDKEELAFLEKLSSDYLLSPDRFYGGIQFPASSERLKTLEYSGSRIHDYAWFADKRFNVLKGSAELPYSGKKVDTYAMFTGLQAYLWKDALHYINNSITHFSEWIGDYPYETYTAVQSSLAAGAGMEYPGIAVIGLAADAYSFHEVIAHEVCHNWFYSSLATDERQFPYLDEGLTTAYEVRYMTQYYPDLKLWELYIKKKWLAELFNMADLPLSRLAETEWLIQARNNLEDPVNQPSGEYTSSSYNNMIYFKSGQGFNHLRKYLGDTLFDSIMTDYYTAWKSKHPYPEDLRRVFEEGTGHDLSWFFDDFSGTTKRTDYKAVRLTNSDILVRNKGEMPAPFTLSGIKRDSVFFENWSPGFRGRRWISIPEGNYSGLVINHDHQLPEISHLNNNISKSGFFPKADPLQPGFLFTIEDVNKHSFIFIPLVSWDRRDGFMAGAGITNSFLLPKPVEFRVMPFYTFRKPGIAGKGRFAINITPYDLIIRKATLSLEGSLFGVSQNKGYNVLRTGIDLYFQNSNSRNKNHILSGMFISAPELNMVIENGKAGERKYLIAGYKYEKQGPLDPVRVGAFIESGSKYVKGSVEFNYKYSYAGRDNGLDLRLFAGIMLKNNASSSFYSFSPAGRSGRELYLYQGDFPDRFSVFPSTFWSRQMIISEGALVSPVNDSIGFSNRLVSISLCGNLPGKASSIPVKPFFNLLLMHPLTDFNTESSSSLYCEAGIKAGIWDFFELYIPFISSRNLHSVTGSVKERIRFVFSLDSFYNFNLRRSG